MGDFKELKANARSIARRKKVQGVGINDATYFTRKTSPSGERSVCPYYARWSIMLKRCYNPYTESERLVYIGCTVSEDWLVFSNFRRWMKSQDWQGKQLDKDIKVFGNRVYSKDTCLFVSREANNILTARERDRGKYMLGVCLRSAKGKYQAHCRVNNKLKHLGYYYNEIDAHNAYLKFKKKTIINLANRQENKEVKKGLLYHASKLIK